MEKHAGTRTHHLPDPDEGLALNRRVSGKHHVSINPPSIDMVVLSQLGAELPARGYFGISWKHFWLSQGLRSDCAYILFQDSNEGFANI